MTIFFTDPDGPVTFSPSAPDDSPELSARLPVRTQIMNLLKRGPLSTQELSEATGESSGKIRVYCSRLKKDSKVMRLDNDKWGLVMEGF
jgi:predicted transcriptional regulator